MTQKQLTFLGTAWQKRLRLQDWDIKFSLVPYHQIDAFGLCTYNPALKIADIDVCQPGSEKPPRGRQPYDPEQTLVHELLHVQFWPQGDLERESERQRLFEQGIDLTAWALVNAQRA